jgi:O-antigen ligase
MAVLLLVAPLGLILTVRAALQRDRAAIAAAALIAWIVVAGLFSGAPVAALKGTIGRELSGLIVVATIGMWALGRQVSERARDLMPVVMIAGLAANGLVAVLQVVVGVKTGHLALQGGRPTGLTPNPVFVGGLMAGGAAVAASVRRGPIAAWLVATAFFGLVVNLSGSRAGTVAGLVATIAVVARQRDPLARRRRSSFPAAFAGGLLLATLIPRAATSTGRVAADSGGDGRNAAWRYGWDAFVERPVFGWGFGRFRAAVQGRFDAAFVRDYASDDVRQAWFDAHNIVVTIVVASGVIGLIIALWFVVETARSASGPLLLFAATLALTWTLQPAGLATLPITMLVLGAARLPGDRPELPGRPPFDRAVLGSAVAVGCLLAGWLVVGDLALHRAVDSGSPSRVEAAANMLRGDAVVADVVAQSWFVIEQFDPLVRPEVLSWARRAADLEPDRPYLWSRLAAYQLTFGDPVAARASLDRALELEPWHLQSWDIMRFLAVQEGDQQLVTLATDRLCQVAPKLDFCAA